MHHIITEIYPISDYRLLAVFDNGVTKIYDVKPLFDWREVFKTLKNNNLFDEVFVDTGGYGVVWNDQVDLSSEEIWNRGEEISLEEDELDILLAEQALIQYQNNRKTYSHSEIKKIIEEEIFK